MNELASSLHDYDGSWDFVLSLFGGKEECEFLLPRKGYEWTLKGKK